MELTFDESQVVNGSRLRANGAGCVVYHRDAVPLGPFDEEPLDLWQLLSQPADGTGRSVTDMREAGAAWLDGALRGAGVDLRAFDRSAARHLSADCGTPEVQVIAGWIVRARPPDPGAASPRPDHRRSPVERLLDALHRAEVAVGGYDAVLPRYLAEDHGPDSVRVVTGWLGRVGRRNTERESRGPQSVSGVRLNSR